MGAAGFDKSAIRAPGAVTDPGFHLTCPFPRESVCLMSPSLTPTHLLLTLFPFSHISPFLLLRVLSVSLCMMSHPPSSSPPPPPSVPPPGLIHCQVHLPLPHQPFWVYPLTPSFHLPTHLIVRNGLTCCGGCGEGGLTTGTNC